MGFFWVSDMPALIGYTWAEGRDFCPVTAVHGYSRFGFDVGGFPFDEDPGSPVTHQAPLLGFWWTSKMCVDCSSVLVWILRFDSQKNSDYQRYH